MVIKIEEYIYFTINFIWIHFIKLDIVVQTNNNPDHLHGLNSKDINPTIQKEYASLIQERLQNHMKQGLSNHRIDSSLMHVTLQRNYNNA